MIQSKINIISSIRLANNQELQIRSANKYDVGAVTTLTHQAFEVWKAQGLRLSPMFQTEEKTASYLIEKGFVVENLDGEIIATFSLENGSINNEGTNKVNFIEGNYPVISFDTTEIQNTSSNNHLLIFKKLAVAPAYSKLGLGNQLYKLAEDVGRDNGYSGMILETVKDAKWLYDWYVRLGFKPIGVHKYTGSQIETVLMTKIFSKDSL